MAGDARESIEAAVGSELTATSRIAVRKEIAKLPEFLQDGERPVCMSRGAISGRFGLVVVTDRRLLFVDHARIDSKTCAFDLGEIAWVTSGTTPMGYGALRIGLRDGDPRGKKLKILPKDKVTDVAAAIETRISSVPAPPGSEVFADDEVSAEMPVESLSGGTDSDTPNITARTRGGQPSPSELVEQLYEMKERGLITAEEFEQKKERILSELSAD